MFIYIIARKIHHHLEEADIALLAQHYMSTKTDETLPAKCG
jgi:hypothetical protein